MVFLERGKGTKGRIAVNAACQAKPWLSRLFGLPRIHGNVNIRWQASFTEIQMSGNFPNRILRPLHLRPARVVTVLGGLLISAIAQTGFFSSAARAEQTDPAGPVVVVSGALSAAVGMNSAGNALGQGNRANATIGRAVQLVVRNVGGARPQHEDSATHGQPGKLTACFAERLGDSLEAIVGSDTRQLVVDLAELEFMDSAGIAMLLRTASRIDAVELRNPSEVMRRIIECTGLTGIFRMTG